MYAFELLRRGQQRLDAQSILEEAQERTALDEPDSPVTVEALGMLCRALEGEARLSRSGRIATWAEVTRLADQRLRVLHTERTSPAPAVVEAPLVITGLPRCGSAFLQELLALDPRHRAPRTWEALRPCPPPIEGMDDPKRVEAARRHVRFLERAAPEIQSIRPLRAHGVEECLALTALTFESHLFPVLFHVPTYRAWLVERDRTHVYTFHRRVLSLLASRARPRRWVLRSAAHLFALDALIDIYPDVRIIHLHRDPLDALPSMASLTWSLRSGFSDAPDPEQVGPEVLELWSHALRRSLAARARRVGETERFFDLRFDDLVGNPVRALAEIYEWLGCGPPPEMADHVRARAQTLAQAARPPHAYTLAEFGLDRDEVGERLGAYAERFGVGRP